MTRNALTGLLAGAALLSSGLAASADTLNYGFGYPAASTVGVAAEAYAEAVKERSQGATEIRNFPLSLVSLAEAGPGVRDGLADVAYVLTGLQPGDFPRYNLFQDMQLIVNNQAARGKESVAYAGAVIETTLNCPECLNEFIAQNQVYGGGATSSINMALCTKPVNSIADIQGKKIRTSHAVISRMLTDLGATPVSFPASESYEALSQGVVDCTQLSLPELTNMSLAEVVKAVTLDMPGGLSSSVAIANINLDTWRRQTDEGRAALLWGASRISADITWGYHADAKSNVEVAEKHNVALLKADEDVIAKMRAFAEADLPKTIADYQSRYNIANAPEMAENFQKTYAAWLDLVDGVEDRDGLRALFWERIFSKVDPKTYGM